ncbi:MAG TPA: aminodeoxychorismate/anthranilate synthase component II [Gemmatimonadaceae bacterium]|nr:aminodeoxychorismate/anthranilate synthase component II [Gemmatimonadaceae bacterium]
MIEPLRVVFVDNFDSFTWNLVDEFARRGAHVEVWRNTVTACHVLKRAGGPGPSLIVLSPGPGSPAEAGCCIELVGRAAAAGVPLFGVCLGHQAMIESFGGVVAPAGTVVHGKTSRVRHAGGPLFEGIPSPFTVGRYHSLAATVMPGSLEPIANAEGIVMGVAHRTAPQLGVQFHPESILTPEGGRIIENVMRWADSLHDRARS